MRFYPIILLLLVFPLAFALDCTVGTNTACCIMQNASSSYTLATAITNTTATYCIQFNNSVQTLNCKINTVLTGGGPGKISISTISTAATSMLISPNCVVNNFGTALYANKTNFTINGGTYNCLNGTASCVQFDGSSGSGLGNATVNANGTGYFCQAMTSKGFVSNVVIRANSTCLFLTNCAGFTADRLTCSDGGANTGGALFISTASNSVKVTNTMVTTSGTTGACPFSASGSAYFDNVTCKATGSGYALQMASSGTTNNKINNSVMNASGTGVGCDIRIHSAGEFFNTSCDANGSVGFGTALTGFHNTNFTNGSIWGGGTSNGAVSFKVSSENNTVAGAFICSHSNYNLVQFNGVNAKANLLYNNIFCNQTHTEINDTAGA